MLLMKHFAQTIILLLLLTACGRQVEHTAPPIYPEDSVAIMTSYGVNTLVSDSGVMKYRIVCEEWQVNQNINPSRWIFQKGLFLEQFDQKFHIQSYIQCDTAYYYDKLRLWELRSRVRILTADGLSFSSEELFWDEANHQLYSNCYSHLVTPERELEGAYFRSNEDLTQYYISNTRGSFDKDDVEKDDTLKHADQREKEQLRSPAVPQPKH